MKCLISGDESALVVLYGKYHRMVYFSALKMVQSDETAKDITQNVFMKIWEHRRRLDPEQNFAAYIQTMCRNAVFDELKRIALDDELKRELQQEEPSDENEENEVRFRETYYRLLHEAIEKLPPQRRAAFEACKLKKQSYDLVARRMGISRSTVQDHIVKANKFIREYISEQGDAFLVILFLILAQG
ncbi:MAG: RNA polymerase sigma-70 factor [Bacteroidales bacterium]|nr:RNA polymerase sigma-70 factor [Bacteroidales bacterium]